MNLIVFFFSGKNELIFLTHGESIGAVRGLVPVAVAGGGAAQLLHHEAVEGGGHARAAHRALRPHARQELDVLHRAV